MKISLSREKLRISLFSLALVPAACGNQIVALPVERQLGVSCDVLPPYASRVTISVKQRVNMAREQHRELRRLANASLPKTPTMILIMLSSGHHSFTNLSYIATRSPDGVWTVDRVGRTTYNLPGTFPAIEPAERRDLSKADGESLDVLLGNKCLYAQPFMTTGLGQLGGWQTSLAVITPNGKYAGSAFGPIPSIGGKVVSAVTGW